MTTLLKNVANIERNINKPNTTNLRTACIKNPIV